MAPKHRATLTARPAKAAPSSESHPRGSSTKQKRGHAGSASEGSTSASAGRALRYESPSPASKRPDSKGTPPAIVAGKKDRRVSLLASSGAGSSLQPAYSKAVDPTLHPILSLTAAAVTTVLAFRTPQTAGAAVLAGRGPLTRAESSARPLMSGGRVQAAVWTSEAERRAFSNAYLQRWRKAKADNAKAAATFMASLSAWWALTPPPSSI